MIAKSDGKHNETLFKAWNVLCIKSMFQRLWVSGTALKEWEVVMPIFTRKKAELKLNYFH